MDRNPLYISWLFSLVLILLTRRREFSCLRRAIVPSRSTALAVASTLSSSSSSRAFNIWNTTLDRRWTLDWRASTSVDSDEFVFLQSARDSVAWSWISFRVEMVLRLSASFSSAFSRADWALALSSISAPSFSCRLLTVEVKCSIWVKWPRQTQRRKENRFDIC